MILEKAITYGIETLGLQDVCLDIYFDDSLEIYGEFLGDDESCEVALNPDNSMTDMLITLFHELIHVQQYTQNRRLSEREAYKKEMFLFRDFLLDLKRRKGDNTTMNGTVTKKHFFLIWSAFGFRKACRILFSKKPVALQELMK